MTDSLAIETRDLAKRYKETIALAGLTMTVPRGEVFGFLGPNGAGKTTAVKLLLGLAQPSGGKGVDVGLVQHKTGPNIAFDLFTIGRNTNKGFH